MAQLRDRFASHNFDDNGNDTNMKSFMDAISKLPITKELKDIAAIIKEQKEINKLEKQYYKEQLKEKLGKGIANLPKNAMAALGGGVIETGKAIGSGAKALAGDTADFAGRGINTLLAASGPVGYALAGALNVGKGVAGLVKAFGRGATSRSGDKGNGLTSEGGNLATRSGDGLPSFETYPTIKKLSHFMDAKISMDTKLNKAYDAVAAFSEKGYNADLKQYKEQDKMAKAQKKVLDEMQKDTSATALNNRAILGAVLLGVVGITALGFAIKGYFDKNTALLNPENTTADTSGGEATDIKKEFKSGEWAEKLRLTSGFGKRVSPGGVGSTDHKGIDIAGGESLEGAPVRSLAPGYAKAYMQVDNGKGGSVSVPYQVEKRGSARIFKGYGRYVDVTLLPSVVENLGYSRNTNIVIRYAHLSAISIPNISGCRVKQGDIIGKMGNSGVGTGVHTHIEVRVNGVPKNPENFNWSIIDDNGKKISNLKTSQAFIQLSKRKFKGKESFAEALSKKDSLENVNVFTSGNEKGVSLYEGGVEGTYEDGVMPQLLYSAPITDGSITGGAASIDYDSIDNILSIEGKNDIAMATNNIGLRRSIQSGPTVANQQQPKPIIINNTPQKQEEATALAFDLENDATKAMKNARPQVDFWQ